MSDPLALSSKFSVLVYNRVKPWCDLADKLFLKEKLRIQREKEKERWDQIMRRDMELAEMELDEEEP